MVPFKYYKKILKIGHRKRSFDITQYKASLPGFFSGLNFKLLKSLSGIIFDLNNCLTDVKVTEKS